MSLADDGWINLVDSEAAIAAFYSQCDSEEAAAAAKRLRPTALACLATPTSAEPWHHIDITYVLCQADAAVRPESQRGMSTRAANVVEIDTDHSPFFSAPDRLTAILAATAS